MTAKNTKDTDNKSITGTLEIDAHMKNLFSSWSQGIIFHDENGKVIDANPAAEKLLNATISQLQGKEPIDRDWKIVYPNGDVFPEEKQPAAIALKTGKLVENVVLGIYNDLTKNYTWVIVNSVPRFKENSKKPYQVYTTFTDISNQINAENLLAKERSLHELLIKTSREFISVSIQNIDVLINKTLADLGNYIGADRFYVFDYDFKNNLTSNTYEWCANDILPQIDTLKNLPLDLFSDWTAIHRQGKSIIIDDVLSLEPLSPIRDLLLPQGIKSLIAVPLINGNNCIGFVGFDAVKNHHKFTSLEQTLLNVFASSFVNLINRKNAEAALLKSNYELGERHKELECIYKITQLGEIDSISFDNYFEELTQIIPQAFQFPQNTSVKITINQKEFKSNPYLETNKVISIDLNFQSLKEFGQLTIYNPTNEPFLDEECQLIENIKRIVEQNFERKESQKRLIASEEKYRIISDNNFNWEYWKNEKGDYIYHSPACFKTTGYAAEELLQNKNLLLSIIHPDDVEHFHNHDEYVQKHHGPQKLNFKITTKTGEIRYIEHVCKPVYDKQNNFIGIRGSNIDITENKLAEIALKTSEERLRGLVNGQTNYVIRTDLTGLHTFWNKRFEDDFGWLYNHSGLDSADSLKSVCNYHHERVYKTVADCLANIGTAFRIEIDKPSKNGGIISTLWEFACIPDVNNQPHEIQCVGIDITDRVIAEQKLAKSEEKYRQLFMRSPEAFLLLDNDTIVDCNIAASKLIELKREDIIGKSPIDLSPKMQPGNKASVPYANDLIKNAYKEGFINFEWVHLKGNGSPFLTEVRLSNTHLNGKDLLFASWRDISKLRQTEEEFHKFKIIADQAYYGSAIATLEGEITYCNNAFAYMHGYQVDELIGKPIAFLHNSEQLKEVVPLLQDIRTKGGFDATEIGHLKKDGSTFPTLMTAKLILDNENTPLFLSATLIDISERKKIDQEIINLNQNLEKKILERTQELENSNELLVQAYKEAEKANLSKTDFLSRMSHELRTPMNSILGFAQLLEMSDLNERDQKAVSRILDSGNHLLNLINEVLDISKIEAGKISISLEPVEIKTIIDEVNESLSPQATLSGISIHNLTESLEPSYVKADAQRLKQILINLVNNAIKYNKKNGDVWIHFEPINQKSFVKITIEDNGIGIDEANQMRIFKPFERVAIENQNIEGTGLGLSVVKQLVGLMGGTFGVESTKGVGSKFWIELPASISDLDRINANGDLHHQHIEMASFNGNLLFIEDNSSNIELIEQVLNNKRPNINIITSKFGAETLDLAKKHSPKLILLDLNLPDMHGSKVLAELTLDPLTRNMPVIILSADASPSQVLELMNLGAKNYLTKPININEFLKEIDSYIQH